MATMLFQVTVGLCVGVLGGSAGWSLPRTLLVGGGVQACLLVAIYLVEN